MNLAIYFRLIRWKNLLLISYVYILLKFVLFPSFHIETLLSPIQFIFLVLAVLLITAAGYIINDIVDIKSDEINKPNKVIVSKIITIEKAYNWYKITNTFGLAFGVLACLKISKPSYSFIFFGTALLLYWYAKRLKGLPLIGNLIVSFLIAFSILIPSLFDLEFTIENNTSSFIFTITVLLAGFAFLTNLARELIKDIEDINGDNILKLRTLPIVLGKNRTRKIAIYICVITLISLMYITLKYSSEYKIVSLYLVVFTIIPLLFTIFKLNNSKTKKQFHFISIILKIIMFLGINSLIILSKYH